MFKKITFSILVTIFSVVGIVAAQSQNDIYVPDGHILVNPNPGIVAMQPSSINGINGGASTNTVSYSNVGGGDAYLSYNWFNNNNLGHARTWLENWVPQTGVLIGARVSRFTVASNSMLSNDWAENNNASGGSSIHKQLGPIYAQCGDPVGVDSHHKIYKSGLYNWYAEDSDFWYFCS